MRRPLLYRALLHLYPASFRGEYGDEMWLVFAERRRQARGTFAVLGLWLAVIADALGAAARIHADILRQDLGYAFRTFRRAPGFTATVIIVAALGIGATTAAFTLTDHVLLRPLPFVEPSRLVLLWQNQTGRGYTRMELSPPNYQDWKAMTRSFAAMGAYTPTAANLVGLGPPQRLTGAAVTSDFLPILGVQPALGRLFTPDDDRYGAAGTVILSHGLWQTAFAGDPDILGRRVTLDGEPCTVIGVMPPRFTFPERETQYWLPIRLGGDDALDRTNVYLRAFGRLAPGASIEQARAELDVVTAKLAVAYPDANGDTRATVDSMRDGLSERSRVLVLSLSGAAACVLLIACLNLANLLLARALVRRKELALRTALGAGRERLVRQLITESLVLGFGGGAVGIVLALASLPLLAQLVPPGLPIADPSIDLRVLAVAAVMTVLSALTFGVVPALRACKDFDPETLRDGVRAGIGGQRTRLRRILVIAEISLCLMLLVSSGLLLRALTRLQDVHPGFTTGGVLTARTWLPQPRYVKTADRVQFYDRVLAKTRALPGVTGAAYITFLPMVSGGGIWPIEVKERPQPPSERQTASVRYITPEFFSVMRIPLRSGRSIAPSDTAAAPWVAVVSESFAKRYWPGEDAVGKTFSTVFSERTIVGVVGDVRVRGLERDSEPQMYFSYQQVPDGFLTYYTPKDLVVGAQVDPMTLVPAIRAIVAAIDPEQPVDSVRPLEDVVHAQTAPRRVQLDVIAIFAALAFVLAGIGIYGLLSFGVSHRAQEIGVRMALGATPGSILTMVLREGLILAAIGGALGLALAYVAGRSLEALLAGIEPTDAPTLLGALVTALAMTFVGSLVPAWRAARVDPARAIRAD